MASEDKAKQIDTLICLLEQMSRESASGSKSWERFCKFLANFETLAQLHDPQTTDVAKLTKRKHICYHIASGRLADENLKAKCVEVLAKIDKLIQSEIFPSETDFFALVDWLEQVTFITDSIWPVFDDLWKPFRESLGQAVKISKQLVGFCVERLKHESIPKTAFNLGVFEKTCCIAGEGVSRAHELTVNLDAITLITKLADLMKESKFVAAIDKEQYDLLSDKLWSVVQRDLRGIAIDCFACNYKMDKSEHETSLKLYEEILDAISLLPANKAALEFFLTELSTRSRPESDAVDLAILSRMQGLDSEVAKLWPVLDIHISRGHPKIRIECLKIATGRFRGEREILKAMLDHLDLIIEDTATGKSDDCRDIRMNLVKLLCAIPRDTIVKDIELYLTRIIRHTPVEHMKEDIVGLIVNAIRDKTEFPLDGDLFANTALDRFQQIYQDGVDTRDRVKALRALCKLITAKRSQNEDKICKYIDIIAAGCQGLAPKGSNELIFRILNETKDLIKGDNQLHLLPLARAVYFQDEL